jgi:tetratricopeptide (TPR) repeat protein
MNGLVKGLLVIVALSAPSLGFAQISSEYMALIQQGNAQLQAGDVQSARKAGEAAVHQDATRWEGYALAGGAFMNLKRYEDAADRLSAAIERAPDDKKAALRELRRQCLVAESGSSAAATTPVPATISQAEIVLWKTIESSSHPSDFQAYLSQYPNGAFVSLATQHLQEVAARVQRETEEANKRAAIELQRQIAMYAWVDPSTGLMWEQFSKEILSDNLTDKFFIDEPPLEGKSFLGGKDSAQRTCANSRLIGYSDWRVPTAEELLNVVRPNSKGKLRLDRNLIDDHYANGSTWFWTSTPGEKEGEHIVVTYYGQHLSYHDKVGAIFGGAPLAMCVRSAREKPSNE